MITTPSPFRTRTTTPQKPQTYDRRISREVARLDPETEDAIVSCDPGGCSLTGDAVCKTLSANYPVIPGSLKFTEVIGTNESEVASFTVGLRNGGTVKGIVKLKAVVERDKISAYSDIMVVGIGAKDGRAAILLRYASQGWRPSP